MTSLAADGRRIVKLELSHVDTIHVSSGAQKIASLCIVVKDSPEVDELALNPRPLPKMIITDVVPLKEDPTKAEVFFRNLTPEEIVVDNRRLLLPPGTLNNAFGDMLNGAGEDLLDELYEEDPSNNEDEDEEEFDYESTFPADAEEALNEILEENKEALESNPDNATILRNMFDRIAQQIANAEIVHISEDTNLYSVTISLAEAHLGQMLCVSTNAPAFVLTSESGFDVISSNSDKNVWEDFLAILEFPYPDTSEYFDATATLIQSVTGSFPLNLKIDDLNKLRGDLINKVVSLSAGRVEALVESFGYINKMNKAFKHKNNNLKPTLEDSMQIVTMDAIDKLYDITNPGVIASLVKATPFTEQSIQEMETLDTLLTDSGLNESFADILTEEYEKKPLQLSANPTTEELVAYYSAPATRSSFPNALQHLVDKIQMPLFFENNWVGGSVEIKETKTNIGEINVSKLIAVAVRYARLQEIVTHVNDKFVPVALLIRALNFPSETSSWAYLESIKVMGRTVNTIKNDELFNELMLPGLPNGDNEVELVPEQILTTPGASIMHKVAHFVLEDNWDRELLISKAGTNVLNDFINEVYLIAEEVEAAEDSPNRPCPVMKVVFTHFANQANAEQTVKELGQLILALAELNALKHTNHTQGSPEWFEYVENYYSALFRN